MPNGPVVRRSIAFPKVVALNLSSIGSNAFLELSALLASRLTRHANGHRRAYPIYFIKIVGFHDNAAYNTPSTRRLHHNLKGSKEDVIGSLDRRIVTLLLNDEIHAVVVVGSRSL
jgi:hypothetical protein